jgi:hypothetical protein
LSWADSSFISAAYDTNAGKIVIASRENDSGSLLGRIVVGTVSGTSISFGTVVYGCSTVASQCRFFAVFVMTM